MNDSFEREFAHAMDSLCFSDAAKETMVDRLLAQSQPVDKPRPRARKLAAVLLAAALALVMFTGAAVYTRWTRSMEGKYQPTQQIKEQAEKSGLSTMLETTEAADVFSATDQGITITAVQSVMDKYGAQLVFRVEGFDLPEGAQPSITLAGRELIDGVHSVPMPTKFYQTEQGYQASDGSLEFTLHLVIPNPDEGEPMGKAVNVNLSAIGTKEDPTLVQGSWNLHWNLNGTAQSRNSQPKQAIANTDYALLETDITPISVSALFLVDNSDGRIDLYTELNDPDAEAARKALSGIFIGYRTKDGQVHTNFSDTGSCYSTLPCAGAAIKYPQYQEETKDDIGILMKMTKPLTSIIEPEDVDAIVLLKPESVDKPKEEWTIEDYTIVPLS